MSEERRIQKAAEILARQDRDTLEQAACDADDLAAHDEADILRLAANRLPKKRK